MSNGGKIFFGMFISNFLPCRSATGFLSYWVPLPLPQSQTVCTEKGRPEGTRRCSYPDLVDENRTTGEVLNRLSINGQRVVTTKDSDFYHSHLLHGKPWKLLLIRTGTIWTGWQSTSSHNNKRIKEPHFTTARKNSARFPASTGTVIVIVAPVAMFV